MEYIAEITNEERSRNKQFWKYTFRDVKTNKIDWFLNNYSIPYIRGLVGRLKLKWDGKRQCWLYQDFNQNIDNLRDVEEEGLSLGLWEEVFEKKIKGVESELVRTLPKPFKNYEEFIERLHWLYKKLGSWKKVAESYNKPTRSVRRWRNKPFRPKQKRGPKFKIDQKSFYHLIHSIQTEEAQTLKEASNYVFNKTGLLLSVCLLFIEY